MQESTTERILDVVASIPAGRVATYGDVAALAGSRSARFVGRVLALESDDSLPWHRVVPASGRPVLWLAERQLSLLAAEDVHAVDGRIPVRKYRLDAREWPRT
jgi:methylated-DNA-protein-cysteine methyltransferase-like protein